MIISFLDFPVSDTSTNRLQRDNTDIRDDLEKATYGRLETLEEEIEKLKKQVCVMVNYLKLYTFLIFFFYSTSFTLQQAYMFKLKSLKNKFQISQLLRIEAKI